MTSVAPDAPPNDGGAPFVERRLPTEVSAAWELELVIAGAVTFALFQLPGSLDALRAWLDARVMGGARFAVGLGYMYTKMMLYVLIAAFLLNLALRAYWVGLVGLHSVFPNGVVWERMRVGPAMTDVYRRRLASLPSVIGRVDNFASVIFSFAFLVVVVTLFSVGASSIVGAVGWGINQLFFGGRHGVAAFETMILAFAVPMSLVGIVDKRFGGRWAPDSVAGRRLRRAAAVVTRVNGAVFYGPIFFTLFTNLRRRRMTALFYATFLVGLTVAMMEFFARLGELTLGGPRYVPDDETVRTVAADHYESLRGPDASTRVATIQSDVIDGPYVKLFVPYLADRHDPALATSCRGATTLGSTHVHFREPVSDSERTVAERGADSVLACLARMHAVTLDGAPVPDLRFRFYTHPATGRRGMIAYLPTAGLAAGPHTLGVMPAPRAPDSRITTPLRPTEIQFWK